MSSGHAGARALVTQATTRIETATTPRCTTRWVQRRRPGRLQTPSTPRRADRVRWTHEREKKSAPVSVGDLKLYEGSAAQARPPLHRSWFHSLSYATVAGFRPSRCQNVARRRSQTAQPYCPPWQFSQSFNSVRVPVSGSGAPARRVWTTESYFSTEYKARAKGLLLAFDFAAQDMFGCLRDMPAAAFLTVTRVLQALRGRCQ